MEVHLNGNKSKLTKVTIKKNKEKYKKPLSRQTRQANDPKIQKKEEKKKQY